MDLPLIYFSNPGLWLYKSEAVSSFITKYTITCELFCGRYPHIIDAKQYQCNNEQK